MNRKIALGLSATLALVALGAGAAGPSPEDVVEYRQSMMLGLGWNVGAMGAMVKGDVPWDQKKFAFLAARAAALAPMSREGFTPDTAKAKSHAKPALWENLPDFDKRTDELNAGTKKLAEVAQGGDEGSTKKQFGETVKACKGCHDKYKEKD